jgi:hypothetical protein
MSKKTPLSKRVKAREAAITRRASNAALREAGFEALAAGWSPQPEILSLFRTISND